MTRKPLCVLDSCVFVEMLLGANYANPDAFEPSLQACQTDEYQLAVAALTISEVIGAIPFRADKATATAGIRGARVAPAAVREAAYRDAQRMMGSGQFMAIQCDKDIAEQAGHLARSLAIKPADATIIVSAYSYGAKYMVTWDGKLLAKHDRVLADHNLAIVTPRDLPISKEVLPISAL